jgi:hypothetical protein
LIGGQHRLGPENRARPSRDNARVRSNALAISRFTAAAPTSVGSRFLSIPLRVIAMLDVVLIAVGVGFFVASILYVLACERM